MASRSMQTSLGHVERKARGNKNYSMAPMADLKGHTGKSCQFIAGEDHYMCGEPGFPYCPDHYALTHRKAEVGDASVLRPDLGRALT